MADFDDVRTLAMALPDAEERNDQFRVRGKLFAWPFPARVEGERARVPDFERICIRVDGEAEKQALLASDERKFFTTPHYDGYPTVNVNLAEVASDELRELLTDAWRVQAPKRLQQQFDAAD